MSNNQSLQSLVNRKNILTSINYFLTGGFIVLLIILLYRLYIGISDLSLFSLLPLGLVLILLLLSRYEIRILNDKISKL
jgi:hypothetical protein